MRNLNEIREDINVIDDELLKLFVRRMNCVREVGEYKRANNIPIYSAGRENEILDRVEAKGGEYGAFARRLFAELMRYSKELQQSLESMSS